MSKYAVALLLMMCLTHIRAPQLPNDPVREAVKPREFEDWRCEEICNDANKERVRNWCLKLSGTTYPVTAAHIRENSGCDKKFVKLIKDNGASDEYQKTVGFCDMGPGQHHKCITKSRADNDLLIWNYEGEFGRELCDPKYEKTGWLAEGGEF